MKPILPALLSLAPLVCAHAQTASPTTAEIWGRGPSIADNIIPPAPDVAQAVRYADAPVSHCLGQVEVRIPICEAVSRSLRLHVELSYATGGIRVDEVPGVAGLGWSLDAGGVIAREIVYMPDEYVSEQGLSDHFFRWMSPDEVDRRVKADPKDALVTDYFRDVTQARCDAGRDRYTCRFGGRSGSFVVDRASGEVVRQIGIDDSRIVPAADGTSFTIVAGDGTQYLFSECGKVGKRRMEAGALGAPTSNYAAADTWYLTRIVSFNGTDTIRLDYAPVPAWKKSVILTTTRFSREIGPSRATELRMEAPSRTTIEYTYRPKVVTGIRFAGGRVDLAYDDESERIAHTQAGTGEEVSNFPKKLRRIVVRNSLGDTIRRAEFTIDRFSRDKRTRLAALQIFSGTEPDAFYRFEYDNPTAAVARTSQDFFGYFNGEDNPHLNPVATYDDFFCDTLRRRRFSFAHAKTFALATIDRNGVRTAFEYEPNRYRDSKWGDVTIGLRVGSIETRDGERLVKRREFAYDEAQSTVDFSKVDKSFYLTRSASGVLEGLTAWHYVLSLSLSERSTAPGAAPESAHICYGRVTETVTDGEQQVRTDYLYDCDGDKHRYVSTQAALDACLRNDTLSQAVFTTLDGRSSGYAGELRGYFAERPQFFGDLVEKIIYRTLPDGGFEVVSRTRSKYRRSVGEPVETDFFIRHQGIGGQSGEAGLYPGGGDTGIDPDPGPHIPVVPVDPTLNAKDARNFYYFPVLSDAAHASRVYESERIDCLPSGESRIVSKYAYRPTIAYAAWPFTGARPVGELEGELAEGVDQPFLSARLHREEVVSGGCRYRTEYLYPDAYPTLPPCAKLVDENFLAAPTGAETVKTEAGSEIYRRGRYVRYDTFPIGGRSLVLPCERVETLGDSVVRRQEILRYDRHGNILEVCEEGLPPVCYLWSYDSALPVAEVRNARYGEVEAALGGEAAAGRLARSICLDDGQWDVLRSLRNALPDASVTVRRYIPLVGLRTVCDPSGREVRYEYDRAWRLRTVFDDRGEAVESYEYFKHPRVL